MNNSQYLSFQLRKKVSVKLLILVDIHFYTHEISLYLNKKMTFRIFKNPRGEIFRIEKNPRGGNIYLCRGIFSRSL